MKRLKKLLRDPENRLDHRLQEKILEHDLPAYVTNVKTLPAYRFVDLYRALENRARSTRVLDGFDANSGEDLVSLLHADAPSWGSRDLTKASRSAWTVDHEVEEFLPTEKFWTLVDSEIDDVNPVIVRVKYMEYHEQARLEVAARTSEAGSRLVGLILEASLDDSIYRNGLLSISFEGGTKDEFGDIDKVESLRISFSSMRPVQAEQFVAEDAVLSLLQRNVIDLHLRRELLKKHGVPVRRGVLMYGPPGTGKTFACRHVCSVLTSTTRILVAGNALSRVAQIFDVARLYHPSLVVLEDVDLAFASRDINLYSSALGELLDQMDGLRPNEDIGILLTTNSIDRMESAIKDRPGRISQCIYLGAPDAALRLRYLEHYTSSYDCSDVDLRELVRSSDGATPAFIKEWTHRSVQMAVERLREEDGALQLTTEDFIDAKREMTRFTNESGNRIVGFVGN